MSEKHIFSMSAEELDDFMEGGFHELNEEAQRAVGTMMLLCTDYVEYIMQCDLWDDFTDYMKSEEVEIH